MARAGEAEVKRLGVSAMLSAGREVPSVTSQTPLSLNFPDIYTPNSFCSVPSLRSTIQGTQIELDKTRVRTTVSLRVA